MKAVPRHIVCLTFDFDTQSGFIARGLTTPTALSRGELGAIASRRILDRLGFRDTARIAMFSKGAGTEVPVMRMELTRQHWAEAKGRRR